MQIGIDARLNAYRRGGIPQYTRQLLTALAALSPADAFVALQHPEHLRPIVVSPNVSRRTLYTPPHHRLEQVTLPVELLPLRLSLLHTPDFIPPLRRSCPAVTTIHDLAFMRYPEILDDSARRYYSQARQAVHGAEGVIAVSQATRNDIVELLDLDPARIDVIYEAAAPAFQPRQLELHEEREVNGHMLRAGDFVLFVSTLEPRKNLPLLLQALRTCIDRSPKTPYRLVVVGSRGWRYDTIFDTFVTLRLAPHVDFLDSVTQSDLLWLYNACRIFAMPSIYEGFGLPLLEAMACGAPSLASDVSSLPEIAADAAMLLPPDDPAAWADAIQTLWKDDQLRTTLAQSAIARAATFSWQQAARETLALYRRIALVGRLRNTPSAPIRTQLADPPATPATPLVADVFDTDETAGALTLTEPIPADDVDTLPIQANDEADLVPRLCLRCAATLAPAGLQQPLAMVDTDNTPLQVSRLWFCPNCGYAELVVEQPAAE